MAREPLDVTCDVTPWWWSRQDLALIAVAVQFCTRADPAVKEVRASRQHLALVLGAVPGEARLEQVAERAARLRTELEALVAETRAKDIPAMRVTLVHEEEAQFGERLAQVREMHRLATTPAQREVALEYAARGRAEDLARFHRLASGAEPDPEAHWCYGCARNCTREDPPLVRDASDVVHTSSGCQHFVRVPLAEQRVDIQQTLAFDGRSET